MGKHIIISREGGDFSMDLIFAGLVRRFGKENVIDYPVRAKHRQGRPVLVGDHERDYGAERMSLCYVDGCEDMREWSNEEVVEEIKAGNVDYIWHDETIFFEQLPDNEVPVVIVAGHDHFRGDPKKVHESHGDTLKAMFCDDWKDAYADLSNTHLINLSCNFDHLWEVDRRDEFLADKRYDICFIGYNSFYIRKQVIDHVKSRWGHLNNCIIFEERPNQFDMFIRHDEMFKSMAQSKICLNLPGASTDGRALRYYETPYVGSCMLSCGFPARLLHPFEDLRECVMFDTDKKLDAAIGLLLDDDELREDIASAGHAHCMRHHTIDARMDYIFGVLDE